MKLTLIFLLLTPYYVHTCKLIDKGPVKCDEIKEILDLHNKIRAKAVNGETKLPKGKNMFALKWKKDLADASQKWANKCHDKIQHSGAQAGENIASKSFSSDRKADIATLVGMWEKELESYEYGTLPGPNLADYGHYTQMIWANTKYVGCGLAYYQLPSGKFPYKTYLVCQYEPAGNFRGEYPYEKKEGTNCDNGFDHKKYKGLCAHDKNDQNENYSPCSATSLVTSILPIVTPLVVIVL